MVAIDLPPFGANVISCGSTVSKIQQSSKLVVIFLPFVQVCDGKAQVTQILTGKFWRFSVVLEVSGTSSERLLEYLCVIVIDEER